MRRHMKYVLLILALVMIGLGVWREEFLIVLRKATQVCFECIGIG